MFIFSGTTQIPEVTTLTYRDSLMMGLGTSTGHVSLTSVTCPQCKFMISFSYNFMIDCFFLQILLYDIRSDKPLLIKDHQYGLPINGLSFQDDTNMVLSTDSKILKIWNRETVFSG